MKRGPAAGSVKASNGDDRTFVEKARAAWGANPPEWVMALADLTDRKRLKGAALEIGYSTTAVSQAINKKNDALDLDRIAEKVAGALLGVTVECPEPALGTISRKICLDWQQKPRAATSSLRARMYHQCRKCPNYRPQGGSDAH